MRLLKRRYIIIFGVALLILIPVILIPFSSKKNAPPPKLSPTPTNPSSQNSPGSGFLPSMYDSNAEDRLLEKIKNRQPLSANDTAAKNRILALLPSGARSGIIFQSQNIIIDYTAEPNVFQVEILTTNTEQAKAEGVNWFRSQGLSSDAICNYPVEFFLNFDIKAELRESNPNTQFSPLAEGC